MGGETICGDGSGPRPLCEHALASTRTLQAKDDEVGARCQGAPRRIAARESDRLDGFTPPPPCTPVANPLSAAPRRDADMPRASSTRSSSTRRPATASANARASRRGKRGAVLARARAPLLAWEWPPKDTQAWTPPSSTGPTRAPRTRTKATAKGASPGAREGSARRASTARARRRRALATGPELRGPLCGSPAGSGHRR